MKMVVKISGLQETLKALADLPKATGNNVLLRVGKKALEPMRAMAASLAPVDEGNLSQKIEISTKRTRRARKERGPKRGVEIAMGPASGSGVLEYAGFVEFGTVDTAPEPHMRPAYQSEKQGVVDAIGNDLMREIDKSAKRLAKKRGKG